MGGCWRQRTPRRSALHHLPLQCEGWSQSRGGRHSCQAKETTTDQPAGHIAATTAGTRVGPKAAQLAREGQRGGVLQNACVARGGSAASPTRTGWASRGPRTPVEHPAPNAVAGTESHGSGTGGRWRQWPRGPQYLAMHARPATEQRALTQARRSAQLVLPCRGIDDLDGRVTHCPVNTEVGRLSWLPCLCVADACR